MTHDFSQIKMSWNYPTKIHFGVGRINDLPEACRSLGMQAPLLITDQILARLPMIEQSKSLCISAGLRCEIFSQVQANPVEADVVAGVEAYHAGQHDGVIAMGGGSALDAAKAVALMVGQDRPLWDFEDQADWYTRVNEAGMAPVVAVPTTSGTGSEVGRCSVITDVRDDTKKIIFHPNMLPAVVIADPQLTVTLPAHITAAVGMDALSHNLEAWCSPLYHPMADGIAVEGIKLVQRYLLRAYTQADDLTARSQMLIASTMGATAFQKGLGAMHAMSHPCGAVLHTHHGLTNAVVMPYVLAFNRSAIEGRIVELAHAMQLSNPSFDGFMQWVLQVRQDLKIPHTLSEIGVGTEHVSDLARRAVVDPTAATNPINLTVEKLEGLFHNALTGIL